MQLLQNLNEPTFFTLIMGLWMDISRIISREHASINLGYFSELQNNDLQFPVDCAEFPMSRTMEQGS